MGVTVLDRELWIVTVDGVLGPGECLGLIEETEAAGFRSAPITTAFGFVHAPEVRNNGRVMRDDVERAAWLWGRVSRHVPAERRGWRAVGLNERFRFYRYEPGQYFRWHRDGAFVRSPDERSLLTLMVYLNGDVEGGETQFDDLEDGVRPVEGRALLFDHAVRHQGATVTGGVKYVLRTDVMYRRPDRAAAAAGP